MPKKINDPAVKTLQDENQQLQKKVKIEQEKLLTLFEQAPAFICTVRGKDHVFELANKQYLKLVGHRDIIGKPVKIALPEVVGQGFIELLDTVLTTGKPYIGNEIKVLLQSKKNAQPKERFVNFVYQPIIEVDKSVSGIFVHGVDITEQVINRKLIEESEERYRTLLTSVDEGFCIVEMLFDKKGKAIDYLFLEVNPVFEKQTGIKNPLGKTIKELVPAIEKSWFDIYGEVALTGKSNRFENGSVALGRWFSVYANRVGDNDSRKVAILFNDITEMKLAQLKLEESETRLRFMADSMPQQVWTATPDGRLDYINAYAAAYFDKSPEKIVGDGWQSVIHADDLSNCIKVWTESLKTGKPYQVYFRLRKSDGVYRWHLGRALAFTENKKIVKWFGTNTDVDDQKRLERQKDDFIGIASHELKTPVTSLKGYTQVLQVMAQRSNQPKYVDLLSKMDAQLNKLTDLIGDLLDVTKIETGRLHFNLTEFDFDMLVDDVVESLQLTTEKHTLIREGKTKKNIYGDRDRIEQVMNNLISNAIKYSPHSKKIMIFSSVRKDLIEFCVQDFGIGIPKDKQEKVLSGPNTHTFPGLGLGLYISSEIVKRLDGRIWVNSNAGKGSTFCFSLPIGKRKVTQQETHITDEEVSHL
jgi:PAS domain S-box-containing protein